MKDIGLLFLWVIGSLNLFTPLYSQSNVVDKVVAVVGSGIVTKSQLESQYLQYAAHNDKANPEKAKCKLLEQLMFQKLLLAQAQKDSISVSDGQVEQELDRRLKYFISQFGSEQKFVDYYSKSVEDFKSEMRDDIKELLLSQKMQSKITEEITVTPSEVRNYFNLIPKDSLPFINEEVEIGQIIKKPPVTLEAKRLAKEKLQSYRDQIINGKDFAAFAALYSEDPGSANKGGEYDSLKRGVFVPEFEAVAFQLKVNEISPVFETTFGYHIIQLLARRGEEVDLRHILITPKFSFDDLQRAKSILDSLYRVIKHDSLDFREAASRFSDDEEGRMSGGLVVNPMTGATRFEKADLGQFDPTLAFTIDRLKVKEVTEPSLTTTKDGKQAYRILYLKSRSEPHKANLKEDYQKIQAAALNEKQQKLLKNWVKKRLIGTFVHIDPEYANCKFYSKWLGTNN